MGKESVWRCDGPECDHWAQTRTPNPPAHHLVVFEGRGADAPPKIAGVFCNGDCLMKWAASWSEPPIIIPAGSDEAPDA